MTTRPLPSYFQGKERLETWPPLRKTVRMGTPDELAVGDRTRALDHATAGRSAEAVAYLRYVHPGNRMMIEVTFEWCLRTHIEMVHARGAAAADEAAVRTETAWRGLCGVAEGLAPTQTFQTHLSAAWLRENAVRALSSKRTRTLSIAHPALTDELEERLSEAITATEQPDRAAAVAAIERYHRHACSCHDVLIAYLWAFADTTARIAGDNAAEQMLHDAFKSTPAVNLLWPALHMLTAEDAAFALAEHMRGHFSGPDRAGAVRIVEEEDRYRLVSDPCGSGGAMRRRLQGSAMQDVAKRKEPTHTSWGEAGVPFYCMHCAHNEIRSIQTIGFPRWVTDYRPEPGKPCEWVIYKRPEDIPERYFTRIGCSRDPRRFKTTGGFLGKLKDMAGVLSIMVHRTSPVLAAALVALSVTCVFAQDGAPLLDPAKDAFAGAALTADGQRFDLDLGTKRVNWNKAAWRLHEFAQPRSLGDANALELVVSTDKPRADVGVYLALREADGSWYLHDWAANLTQPLNTGTVRLADFQLGQHYSPTPGSHDDEDATLDTAAISAIAIGCVNPLGVGIVSFTVKALRTTRLPDAAAAPVRAEITGKTLEINGQSVVPPGVFGCFQRGQISAAKYRLALERQINAAGTATPTTPIALACVFDRFNSSPRLSPGWESNMAERAKGLAADCAKKGQRCYVEFWNEPYLNWANANRRNMQPSQYEESKAVEGGPVHFKGTDEVAPHLFWTKNYDLPPWNWTANLQEWRRGRTEDGRVLSPNYARPVHYSKGEKATWKPELHPPDGVKDGEKYTVKIGSNDVQLTAFTPWRIYDDTQFTYWSGKGMLKMYVDPALAFGKALKAADPKALYFVGWGFRPHEDHWAGWDLLYKPTLDALAEVTDGLHEHDYGGDPLKLPASYEVVSAYALKQHGKRVRFVNTEQAGLTDPQAYPATARDAASDLNKYRWTARKTMISLARVPDKVFGFSNFGDWFSPFGEGVLFEQLINLRGRLIASFCPDPGMYVVASVDGTDPETPRPQALPARKELVVAVWNDHAASREVELSVAAPSGMTFDGDGFVRRVGTSQTTNRPTVVESPLPKPGAAFLATEQLGPYSMSVFTFPVAGDLPAQAQVRQKQFVGSAILTNVTPAHAHAETIAIPAAEWTGAKRAWIKFVAERLAPGEGVVELNGKVYDLPSAVTPENCCWLRLLSVPADEIKPENKLTFRVPDRAHAGFLLCMSSLVIETE